MGNSEVTDLAQNVTVGEGSRLHSRVNVESGAKIGACVVFADDGISTTIIRANSTISDGSVVGAGVEVGRGAQVRPGTVLLAPVPSNAIVEGNPARVVGYVQDENLRDTSELLPPIDGNVKHSTIPLGVGNAALHRMPRVSDLRGALTAGEVGKELPFEPRRYFIVFDVPSRELRGEHAHKACHQFLICIHGSCNVLLDDGSARREVVLDRPEVGIYMPPMIWGTQYKYSPDTVLMVLASLPYDPNDYIRSYSEFLIAVREHHA